MRQLPILLAAAFPFIIPASAQMQFSLASDKPVYTVGEPIKLSWKLFNGTKQDWVVFKATVGVRQNFLQIVFRIEAPGDRYNLSLQGDLKAAKSCCSTTWRPELRGTYNTCEGIRILSFESSTCVIPWRAPARS
jgi:hypothetical protein